MLVSGYHTALTAKYDVVRVLDGDVSVLKVCDIEVVAQIMGSDRICISAQTVSKREKD